LTFEGYTVAPDSKWPNMYRVRSPNGTLTDMVNLTRARDAALSFSDQDRENDKSRSELSTAYLSAAREQQTRPPGAGLIR